uniref:HOXD12x n=1 Tax=Pantodon buchholzi TaxID=8276 RepID=A0A088FSD6_PANBU|nr:HOXD12x [Pantodon buchholzi]
MCERSLLSSGYVSSLLSFPAPDFYFPSVRPCALPWTSPGSCASPPQQQGRYPQAFVSAHRGVRSRGPEGDSCHRECNHRAAGQGGSRSPRLPGENSSACPTDVPTSPHAQLRCGGQSGESHGTMQCNPCPTASLSQGSPWCPSSQMRPRKKRKPYAKQQLAELESEFMVNEFINRQRRRELSVRLHLSDQQVKIWFQNRRMKKKRLMMREHAFALY